MAATAWWASWRVFRTAMLFLRAADAELLDNYAKMERDFHTRYSAEARFVLYTSEVRMRSKRFEQLRRAADEQSRCGCASGAQDCLAEHVGLNPVEELAAGRTRRIRRRGRRRGVRKGTSAGQRRAGDERERHCSLVGAATSFASTCARHPCGRCKLSREHSWPPVGPTISARLSASAGRLCQARRQPRLTLANQRSQYGIARLPTRRPRPFRLTIPDTATS